MEQKCTQPEVMRQGDACTVKDGAPKSAETADVEPVLWHGQYVTSLSYFLVTLIWKPLMLNDFDLS